MEIHLCINALIIHKKPKITFLYNNNNKKNKNRKKKNNNNSGFQ